MPAPQPEAGEDVGGLVPSDERDRDARRAVTMIEFVRYEPNSRPLNRLT